MSSSSGAGKDKVILERRFVPKDAVIVRAGDTGNTAYLVQSGGVRVYSTDEKGHEIELARLGSGQIFGEMALVFDAPRTANVQATEDCNLIVITRQTFQKKLAKSDPTVRAMVEMLASRILDINNTLLNKKGNVEDLIETTNVIYQNVFQSLPRQQQRTFQNAVLPRLDGFLDALRAFNERFEKDDS